MAKHVLGIIIGSTRPGRAGKPIADWFTAIASKHASFEAKVLDLKEINLRFLDEAEHPRFKKYAHDHTKKWSALVESCDGFIIVTPEYNYGYAAPLQKRPRLPLSRVEPQDVRVRELRRRGWRNESGAAVEAGDAGAADGVAGGGCGPPSLTSPDTATPGNGLLLFFRVDDFDMALKRARALVARLEEEPHTNPNTRTKEFSLRDPDGYYVTISALSSLELRGHEPLA